MRVKTEAEYSLLVMNPLMYILISVIENHGFKYIPSKHFLENSEVHI